MAFDGSRAGYYRDRAKRARALAAIVQDEKIASQLELIAQQYDSLARQVDEGFLEG